MEHFAKTETLFDLLLKKWDVLIELRQILHLPYLTTVLLQKNDFTLSDFFGCLKIISMKLDQIIQSSNRKHTNLAKSLQQCLNERKHKLTENPLMLCALFLDPRYKCEIYSEPEKVRFVKLTIENLWKQILTVKNAGRSQTNVVDKTGATNTTTDNVEDLFDELDQQYSLMGIQSGAIGQSFSSMDHSNFSRNESNISAALYKYEECISGARVKSSESVHHFWENNKTEYGSELYEIACIIFAIPPTQASVERCFSALKFLFTEYRCNLAEDLLESLMLSHLNPEFYYLVKELDIAKLEQRLCEE